MTAPTSLDGLEPGYDIPALPGMTLAEVQTPCLILDLDALERNIAKLGAFIRDRGLRHRAHAKMHKSVEVARLQMSLGGACGICCQKVSEAEVFARAGLPDILISNQVRGAARIDRLAGLPRTGAAISVCLDDLANVADLQAACARHDTRIEALVEIDCGGARCGTTSDAQMLAIARALDTAPNLTFGGIQAYHGPAQHLPTHADRRAALDETIAVTRAAVATLTDAGLPPPLVTGGGTGSYLFEAASGVFTELQCGSYAFMDADYGRLTDEAGQRLDAGTWDNALFLLTEVMSHAHPTRAICDAGLKVQSLDSGLPVVHGRSDVTYTQCSDEHGTIEDPEGALTVGDRLRLVPGHCDPTCNIHDWYVGLRGDRVEVLWPVSARAKAF
ncbi:DSD1 family PLP-dependent enzyme [Pseudooceanicola marinus]|uniref:DSD1 family PLP-dependent enzyme n=1 Tax=Pseudooceanicola marinus TaxID=396013 RepID=UPI001CD70785|nr:DSD1 family PLP-dependent enzyme [Pseudooceanicola marinus]MCA1337164.1 DSD1 family PLP-dependent enzyme [Pseudooceanicola marinus]